MADSLVSFSGLASGIQWRDLIDQIMLLERRPVTQMQERIDSGKLRVTAWNSFTSQLQGLRDAAAGLSGTALLTNKVATGGAGVLSSATASTDATPGTHSVVVHSLAAAETLNTDVFASRTTALSLAGEFRISGTRLEILATDSLDAIAAKINTANSSNGTGVTATVLSTGSSAHRLVLTASKTGATGIDLVDGGAGVLRDIGLLDGNVAIKLATSNGAQSDVFLDATTTLSDLLGFTSPPPIGDVVIGGVNVSLDLSTMSLTDVADAINTAATAAGRGVTASVIDDGTGKRLDIRGATQYTDDGRVLEALGVLEGGRSAVAQQINSAALESGAGVPATAGTLLTSLWSGGAAAGTQAGDTLTINGTRGDGTTFSFGYTVTGTDTLQDLADRLNSAVDGFGAGSRTATAFVDADGSIGVTDGTGGTSRLGLGIVANNENGGSLDFGAFGVTEAGRNRVVIAGSDAQVEIDGSFITSTSNTVADVVPGLTLSLSGVDPNNAATITVTRDTDAAVDAVKKLVDGYNTLTDWVTAQLTPPAEGLSAAPLYGDSVLRSMRTALRTSLAGSLDTTVTGGLARLSDIGIEIDRTGRYTLDTAKLKTALETGTEGVKRLFGVHGATSGTGLSYVTSSEKTVPGTYAIDITQAATWAAVTGSGFGATYVDDGTADLLNIRDTGSNHTYSVSLSNGMTMAEIVDAINAEVKTPLAHTMAAASALSSDAGGTPATDATLWSDVHIGATNANVTAGDSITIAGTKTDGTSFLTTLVVSAGGTLGELRAAVQNAIGTDVDVTWENGVLTAASKVAGSKTFTLSVTSDNLGGGTFDLGGIAIAQQGRGTAQITASDDNGQLRIAHDNAGSIAGFEVSYTAGGADGSASLGIGAATWVGTDVIGTIGGFATTGSGTILTGAAGTPIEGLLVGYDGTAAGAIGDITFSRGVATRLEIAADRLLGSDAGSIKSLIDRINGSSTSLEDRIETFEARIERRRQSLIRRFTAMEQAMAIAQSQSSWLEAQIAQLQRSSRNSNN
jgi:flagellar hook-associated protein 2